MTCLALYGAKCDAGIWEALKTFLAGHSVTYAGYPHDLLRAADGIADIARYFAGEYAGANIDTLIGHSMGGQIALAMTGDGRIRPQRIILIESSPVPSGALYRNLMTEKSAGRLGGAVTRMFEREAPYYSESLLSSLRDGFDLTDLIRAYSGRIYAIYGDRGCADRAALLRELLLPEEIQKKMDIRFIRDACHLPMLEQPEALASMLNSILSEAI